MTGGQNYTEYVQNIYRMLLRMLSQTPTKKKWDALQTGMVAKRVSSQTPYSFRLFKSKRLELPPFKLEQPLFKPPSHCYDNAGHAAKPYEPLSTPGGAAH